MASLVLKMSVSLDGYVAPIDGSTGWIAAEAPMTPSAGLSRPA
jgi:riboflavin biosynthesis pyrimidine reductase